MSSQIQVSLCARDSEGNKIPEAPRLNWGITAGTDMGEWLVEDISREISRDVRKRDSRAKIIDEFFPEEAPN